MAQNSPEMTEILDQLEKLIAFDTVSRNSNMALIKYVEKYLTDFGIMPQLFMNPEGDKANLLATIGPKDLPGILLSGHSDVVPVDGQQWSSDPFVLRRDGGKLYGRGTSDMKGFIALMLAMVPQLVDARLTMPVHIALSYDEEVGCSGVRSLVDHMATLKVKPKLCIVGEPTSLKPVNAHKGIRALRTFIIGKAGHSSKPADGINALVVAAKFVAQLDQLQQELAGAQPSSEAKRFNPPYSTINVGQVSGGNAINIIAERAEILWEYRTVPGGDAEWVKDQMQDWVESELKPQMGIEGAELVIETEDIANTPPLIADSGSEAEAFVMALALSNDVAAVSYATEAGLFQRDANIPALVCGPGSIDQAHIADEYIELTQLQAGWDFLQRLLVKISG